MLNLFSSINSFDKKNIYIYLGMYLLLACEEENLNRVYTVHIYT